MYHAGFTEDALLLLEEIVRRDNHPPVYLCGFSLGANIMCNLLGRHSSKIESLGIVAAAGTAVPFDPSACVQVVDSGWKGFVYSSHLVRDARKKVKKIVDAGAPTMSVDMKAVEAADRVGKFDGALIAPVFGFKDRFEYYEHVNATPLLKHITVPTLLINALDDPFFAHYDDPSLLPSELDIKDAPVRLIVHKHGGHCGFFNAETLKDPDTGYFQREFGRWFSFVEKARGAAAGPDPSWSDSSSGKEVVH